MIKAAFFNNSNSISKVFSPAGIERIASLTDLYPEIISEDNFTDHVKELKDVQVVFSTWGMPKFSQEQISQLASLKAIFYAAGTVKTFGAPYMKQGVRFFSAWQDNATAVAEFALAQILLSAKRYFINTRVCQKHEQRVLGNEHLPVGTGGYGDTVALIGCGMVARKIIKMLENFDMKIIVTDPYLNEEDANALGVRVVSLEEAFKTAYVISNHLPDIPSTEGLMQYTHFESMREGATFINTGRGRQVAEDDLIQVLKNRTDITALLDVTFPEPPLAGSELYTMNNIFLSSHIAGSMGNEVIRMSDAIIYEFECWNKGSALSREVTMEMLSVMG
jgi:phosphoglycerate dehydrogenase-like enzyme